MVTWDSETFNGEHWYPLQVFLALHGSCIVFPSLFLCEISAKYVLFQLEKIAGSRPLATLYIPTPP